MEEFCSRSHHDVSAVLGDDVIPDILDEQGIPVSEVTDLIQGTHPLSGIIHGELDVDRMDYLLRDAHYTGAPYGTVDAHRLIRSTILAEGSVVLHESGINAAESLLIARTLMRPAVYFHHVSRIAEMIVSPGSVVARDGERSRDSRETDEKGRCRVHARTLQFGIAGGSRDGRTALSQEDV